MIGLIQVAITLLALLVLLFVYRTYNLSRVVRRNEHPISCEDIVETELRVVRDGPAALKSYVDDFFL